ncbi:MAG TPA: hypothetical protein VK787_07995 [Puia sp.]|nr:hypothetical protein [Puia sp.]
MSTYAVIDFNAENQKFSIRSEISTDLKRWETVPVLYQKENPNDAVIDDFMNVWLSTLSYAIFPELVIIVLFVMPERFDPIIPTKSKILIGKNPFIKIIKSDS